KKDLQKRKKNAKERITERKGGPRGGGRRPTEREERRAAVRRRSCSGVPVETAVVAAVRSVIRVRDDGKLLLFSFSVSTVPFLFLFPFGFLWVMGGGLYGGGDVVV
ncbi:hypothetical protein A2U01_0056632, partial [Trifolium medium]|nr:hypothetical protein [Trifolium medium]